MNIGPYAVTHETVRGLLLNPWDSLSIRLFGIPRLPGETPADIAREILRRNARGVLHAGAGHFRFMWVSDFGKALAGAKAALPGDYLRSCIELMIRHSLRRGHVTSCFTSARGFDMPYDRGDNLPWLLYCADAWTRWTGDSGLLEAHRPALQRLLDVWEGSHFEGDLIGPWVTGDWMDTLLRPSSTYNNICALLALTLALRLGLRTRHAAATVETAILAARWRGGHFTDYAGTEDWSVDAGVCALYFGVFDESVRRACADKLAGSGLAEPYPIRCAPRDYDVGLMPLVTRLSPRYHSVIWLHLGMMYLNGLRKLGLEVAAQRRDLETLIMRYRNVLETLEPDGRPYRTLLHSTEHGFSMASGQYLELIGASSPPY